MIQKIHGRVPLCPRKPLPPVFTSWRGETLSARSLELVLLCDGGGFFLVCAVEDGEEVDPALLCLNSGGLFPDQVTYLLGETRKEVKGGHDVVGDWWE